MAQFIKRNILFIILALLFTANALAQKALRADKIIADYAKATNAKSAAPSGRFAFRVERDGEEIGTAQWEMSAPSSWRWEKKSGGTEVLTVNGDSAWRQDKNGALQTLTSTETLSLRLLAQVLITRLSNFKKMKLTANVVGREDLADETANIIELRAGNGASLKLFFGERSKFLRRIRDDVRQASFDFDEYKAVGKTLFPHKIRQTLNNVSETYVLQQFTADNLIDSARFLPPRSAEDIDVVALLKTLQSNEEEVQKRVAEYTFLQKETERVLENDGRVKEINTRVYEVYPTLQGRPVFKLIEENGKPLSADKLEKEGKRAGEELADAEEKYEKDKAKRAAKKDEDEENQRRGLAVILQTSELIAPRREMFRGREAIVVNFRPKAGYKPQNQNETVFSKLAGVVWLDPQERQVIRAEAFLADDLKFGGGILAKVKPNSSFVFERVRVEKDIWLPRLVDINFSVKVLLVRGINRSIAYEYSDYKRFQTETKDYKIGETIKNN